MKRTKIKQLISGLLVFILILGNVPVTVWATETETAVVETQPPTEPEPMVVETQIPTEPKPTVIETEAPTESDPTVPEPAVPETQASTEPEPTVPETQAPSEPAATEEIKPVCTGLADCAAEDHEDICEKKIADDKAAADKATADAVAALIEALPALDDIKAKPRAEQGEDYTQVQSAYTAYCALTADQQALLPPAEDVFKPYFDYFATLTEETDLIAEGTCGENLIWTLDVEGVLTIAGEGEMTNFGLTDSPWDGYIEDIKAVIIDEGINNIGDSVFWGCKNLIQITIPDSVTKIGDYAFYGSGLLTINLPSTLTDLGEAAFGECFYIKSVKIPSGVTSIPWGLFRDCVGLNHIEIPEGMLSIGYSAFEGCVSLKNVDIPDSVTNIEGAAFDGCRELESVVIPEGITKISEYTFMGCHNLEKVVIPDGVTSIETQAFYGCNELESICIPTTVSYIGVRAFQQNKLNTVIIPDNAITIDPEAFAYCSNLRSVVIPSNSVKIAPLTFAGCILKDIYYGGTEAEWRDSSAYGLDSKYVHYMCTTVSDHWAQDTKLATCAESGYSREVCPCGYIYNEVAIPATGNHVFDQIVIDENYFASEATCTTQAQYYYSCSGCGAVGLETFPYGDLRSHNYTNQLAESQYLKQEANCTAPAVYFKSCSCGDVGTDTFEYGSPNAHSYSNGVCTVCGLPEGLEYFVGDEMVTISRYRGTAADIVIPAMIEGKPVTSISNEAFIHCTSLTSITIPESVTSIGERAFFGCSSLTSITSLESVTTIGRSAFNGCTSLASITIPDGVTFIDRQTFFQCSSLTSVTMPKSVTSIGPYAFAGCSAMTSIIIPDSVTSIGEAAFNNCQALTSINIPDGVTSIGNSTFYNCKNLTNVTLPNSVTSIGERAFYDCDSLSSICLPSNLQTIGDAAFYWCTGLTSLVIPNSVVSIGANAFELCFNIENLTLGSSLETIGEHAFDSCSDLKEVTIPASVTSIGIAAFQDCYNLKSIVVDAENQSYSSDDTGVLFDKAMSILVCLPGGIYGEYQIPDGVTRIGDYAIGASSVTLKVPASVSSVGSGIFTRGLPSEMYFEGDAPTFAEDAFYSDYSSSNGIQVYYPAENETWTWEVRQNYGGSVHWVALNNTGTCGDNLTWNFNPKTGTLTISGTGAMDDYDYQYVPWRGHRADIKKVIIGDSVQHIGENAFYECTNLIEATIGNSVTSIGDSAFAHCQNLTKIDLPDAITHIGEYAFTGCWNLTTITIPAGVTRIENGTFSGCGFKTLVLPNSITRIGDEAFYGSSLAEITIPDSATYIGDGAFGYCQNLTSIHIPDGITYIGEGLFAECYNLISVNIPDGVTHIGSYAFGYCESLTTIAIPDGVTVIGEGAFDSTGLTEIAIPDSVRTIGWGAFSGCKKLTSVSVGSGVTEISEYAFSNCNNLRAITFSGNAPKFANEEVFKTVKATAYYPVENPTWTDAVMKDYGGDITWIPYEGTEGKCGENLTWKFDDETGTLTISGTGEMTNYSEPCLDNIPWAPFASSVQKLVVEEGVTSIGDFAFNKCINIKELTLAKTVTTIGGYSFYGNEGIEELVFPEGLKHIGEAAFEFSTNLKKIVIPESLESSGYAPFWCTNPEIVVAGNLTPGLFAYCHYYRVTLGDNITTISEQTFVDGRLGEIVIPASVKVVEKQAFYLCGKGNKIVFKGNAPQIAENAFEETTATIYYPAGNETWSEDVRQNYGGTITWVPLANEGKCGENLIWKYDDATDTLTISGTGRMYDFDWELTAMPWYPLQNEIKKIVVEEGVTGLGQCAFYQSEAATEVSLPSTLVVIGESAFEFCEALEAVTIPNSVEIIGPGAFYMCKSLKSMKLSNNVTSLGGGAFWGCCSLTEVILSKNLETIEAETFADCAALREIVIPDSVKSIGDSAFMVSGLNTITFMGDAPQIAANAFVDLKLNAIYPAGNATWTAEVRQNYGGTITWLAEGLDGNDITMDHDEWAGVSTVWVNGVAYPVVTENGQTKVQIPDGVTVEAGTSMVTYNYHVGDANDVHTQYPTGMQVWILQENELGELIPTRVEELDNILQYSGSSIRITGNKGIRMITSIEQSKKNALVSAGLAEYKLKEYGTALCWARDLAGGTNLTLGQSYVKSNYAYKRGVADPVFKYAGDLMQYTNVLVGFSLDECKDDIAMRPYMILEGPNGEQVTIYGGIIYRSIGYIAYQIRNSFTVGSDAYNYVWNIIHYVYGDQYDADYKG